MPHGATVFGATYLRKAGSRTEPSGVVVAPMFTGLAPWDVLPNVTVACNASQQRGDLTLHRTNHSCLAAVDLGVTYGWYKGVNYALFYNGACTLCELPGNSSEWTFAPLAGAYSYARQDDAAAKEERLFLAAFDADGDGRVDRADLEATQGDAPEDSDRKEERRFEVPRAGDDARKRMWEDERDAIDDSADAYRQHERDAVSVPKEEAEQGEQQHTHTDGGLPSTHGWQGLDTGMGTPSAEGGRGTYILKSYNFGMNWTWSLLPPHLAGSDFGYVADPSNGSVLYGVRESTQCVTMSLDVGDTWAPCWNLTERLHGFVNKTVTLAGLTFKDSSTFIVSRKRGREKEVPLITKDGGKTFAPMESLAKVAAFLASFSWSWSAKTLLVHGSGGVQQEGTHPHTAFVWKSVDDGETWTDETGDIVTMGFGVSGWYEKTVYMSSMGEGIFSKVLE